jgi:hypothetical protein
MSFTNNFLSYLNYINLANANKQNPSLYFYIKNFCFRKMITLASQNPNNFTLDESAKIQNDLKLFKEETQNKNILPLTKEAFSEFMENYYNQINFQTKDIQVYRNLIDITEIFTVFGQLDDLTQQRGKLIYYNLLYYDLFII